MIAARQTCWDGGKTLRQSRNQRNLQQTQLKNILKDGGRFFKDCFFQPYNKIFINSGAGEQLLGNH